MKNREKYPKEDVIMAQLISVGTMDNYYEQIVKKKFTPSMVTAMVLSMIGIVTVIFVSIYLSGYFSWLVPVSLLFMGLGIYLIVYIIKNSGIEYEYTFVLGEMRIERIKGKSKRKNITCFDVKAIDDIGPFLDPKTGNPAVDKRKFDLILKAAENEIDEKTYYAKIHDKVRHKPALVLFTPNETTLEKIKPYLSVELKKKFFMIQKEMQAKKNQEENQEDISQ